MTFLLSEINHRGVIMASDSSERYRDLGGKERFREVEKTLYFGPLNIGVSTWGDAEVDSVGINQWLKCSIREFLKLKRVNTNRALAAVTTFLSEKLNRECHINGRNHMGLHIAGYNSDKKGVSPGICHVFIEPGFTKFDNQHTLLELPKHIPAYHLRNGIYEEFAIMWPSLSGLDESFRSLMASKYQSLTKPLSDPVAVRAEWLGNWVKQMCLVFKITGLPEYIGKTVKVLTFDQQGNVRKFRLGKFEPVP